MTMLKRLAALIAVLALCATVCGCGVDAPEINIEQIPSDPTQATEAVPDAPADPAVPDDPAAPEAPAEPASAGQLTLSDLMGEMGSRMQWSALEKYDHTKTDDTHATFAVSDSEGNECTLTVAFDAATGAVTEATLSYGDAAVDILTDDTMVIRTIMLAMGEG